jgi:type VI secretion system secreted protein VgrG
MCATPTQDTRVAELTTPLGKDRLVLTRFNATEGLSQLFDLQVECSSETPVDDLGTLLGKECSVRVNTVAGKTRYFSGIAVEARYIGLQSRMYSYRLVLRPWLWLLSRGVDSRIFQNRTVVEIFKEVFDGSGFSGKYDASGISESYKSLEYCVQYRESHLHFVLRLLEEFGIYFYFKYEAGKHTLMLADAPSVHKPVPDLPSVDVVPMDERTRDDREFLRSWSSERSFHTGRVTVHAYDFANPDADMKHEKSQPGGYVHDDFEIFVYPHKYHDGEKENVGDRYATATLESRQALDKRRYAAGNAPSLFPGGLVRVQKNSQDSENQEYLLVAARHSVVSQSYASGAGGGGEAYHGEYVLQPRERPFRAPQLTPRPVVHGPQTALVVGPKGEEIHTDKYGRVKLQFHWDRQGKKDDKSSRWVRVAQTWSGKEWGSLYIPRVGMEAVVEFIEGDPDRPIVIGTVYNKNNMPPVGLPANKTQRGLKTRSSKGGNAETYNELFFEDKKDVEFVRFHAEKDFLATVEDTEKRTIKGKNRSGPGDPARNAKIETGDDVLAIDNGDRAVTISRHHTMSVGRNQHITVGQEILVEAGVKLVLKVGGSTITMTPAEIKIQTSKLSTDAPLTEITASAILDAKGGLIKLNS